MLFTPLYWLILGGAFLVLETLIEGFYLIFLGVAAILVGLLLYFTPFTNDIQLFMFGIFSLSSVGLAMKFKFYETAENSLNAPQEAFIGQVFTLNHATENKTGMVKIGDSLWSFETENDLKQGDKIKIIGYTSAILKAEPYASS